MSQMGKDNPNRAAYRAAEVCEIAHIQPYVLRSWESEFPQLGVARGGARIYRKADIEQVLRIRQLVFDEGLTLAGARRRLEQESQPQADLPLEELTPQVKEGLARVKQGLQDLLGILGGPASLARTEGTAPDSLDCPSPGGSELAPAAPAPTPEPDTDSSDAAPVLDLEPPAPAASRSSRTRRSARTSRARTAE